MKNRKLKIAFLSRFSPDDRKASSGTNYKMAEELRKCGDLEWIPITETLLGRIFGTLTLCWNRIFKKHFNFFGSNWGAKYGYSTISPDQLEKYDVIAAFFAMSTLANIKTKKPIIYFSDATAPSMIDYYPREFSNLFQFNKRQLIELEKKAMDNATSLVLSSDWAAESAIRTLEQDKAKVHIVELGANIDDKDIINREYGVKEPLEILFLGVDWSRKGGEIAVDAINWLNENGIEAILHVVGIRNLPERHTGNKYIKNHGFLNKNNPQEYGELISILQETDCLLLPTKAECAGIAFAESSANGIPIFSHSTGGIPNYVIDGINGYLLPLGATGADFGRKIKEVFDNREFRKLSDGGKRIYKEKLNWANWGLNVADIINSLTPEIQS